MKPTLTQRQEAGGTRPPHGGHRQADHRLAQSLRGEKRGGRPLRRGLLPAPPESRASRRAGACAASFKSGRGTVPSLTREIGPVPSPKKATVERGLGRIPGLIDPAIHRRVKKQDIPTLGLGGFGGSWYWSSSQNNINNAWNQNFSDGNQNNNNTNNDNSVRAVRALERSLPRRRGAKPAAGGFFLYHG